MYYLIQKIKSKYSNWPTLALPTKAGNYLANPYLLNSSSIQNITKKSLRLYVPKWWISSFISNGYAEVHIWLLKSILLAQLWYMWAVFWQCLWMMTWGNGLEEHWEIVSWKISICAWQSLSTSPSVAVRGEPRINVKPASWPFMSLYATISYLFMTAKLGPLS